MFRSYIISVLLILILNQSCKKDDVGTPPEDYTSFLNSSSYLFTGIVSDSLVHWQYGYLAYQFQIGNVSYATGNAEPPARSLVFWLTSDLDYSTSFYISTPGCSTDTAVLFSTVLSPGVKQIGNQYSKFYLQLTLNHKIYTTAGDQTNSILKILKYQNSKDEFNRDIVKVWMIVNCKFYNNSDSTSLVLKNGKIYAQFMYNL